MENNQNPNQFNGQENNQYGQQQYGAPNNGQQYGAPNGGQPKQKIVAALLALFLGGLGIHNFYLGFTKKAVIQIIVSFVTCGIGAWWGIIEGILILVGNINVDADGTPLKD